ncbi:hypothetical protein PI124_g21209 [Phytophthora idaei]|nr:hypothetical protein PI124_g21209 [Phytophthora idaei]
MELFRGLQPASALVVVVRAPGGEEDMLVISTAVAEDHLTRLRDSLHSLLKDVVDEKERRRLQAMVEKNDVAAKFDIGDFVLDHATRLKYYTDYQLNITEEILAFVAAQDMEIAVTEVVDHRYNEARKRWELNILWAGLHSIEDSGESAEAMLKDVPNIVKDKLWRAALRAIGCLVKLLPPSAVDAGVDTQRVKHPPTALPDATVDVGLRHVYA